MKTKTFLLGLFVLMSAIMFGMEIWNGIVAVFPVITEQEWVHLKIPVLNMELIDVFKSAFISVLALIGGKITRTAVFEG